jgi:hypothetical protein
VWEAGVPLFFGKRSLGLLFIASCV